MREAGFHLMEVIMAATSVEVGKLADFVIVEENPLSNLKVLCGTGAIKLTEDNEVVLC